MADAIPFWLLPTAQLDSHLGLGAGPCFCGGATGRASSYPVECRVVVRLRGPRHLCHSSTAWLALIGTLSLSAYSSRSFQSHTLLARVLAA